MHLTAANDKVLKIRSYHRQFFCIIIISQLPARKQPCPVHSPRCHRATVKLPGLRVGLVSLNLQVQTQSETASATLSVFHLPI